MAVRSDNGWFSVTFPFDGKRRFEYLGLRDNRENRRTAQKLNDLIKAEIKTGNFSYARRFPNCKCVKCLNTEAGRSELTLRSYSESWLTEVAATVRAETLKDYSYQLRSHVFSHELADKPIRSIDDGDIKRFIADLKAKRLAAGYDEGNTRRLNMVLARLRTIFATAARRRGTDGRTIVDVDPMRFVSNLRQMKPEIDPLTLDEVKRLLAAATGQFKNLLAVLIFTGMRPGESLGLRWEDIDRDRGLIRIRRTLGKNGVAHLPKTTRSERDVEMGDTARSALADQRLTTGLTDSWVFASDDSGAPLNLTNLRWREWSRTLIKARIRERPLYQCRHTYATLLLEPGAQPQYVASQLGHTTIEMLFRTNCRWLRPPTSKAIEELDRRFAAVNLLSA
jgi:integrase